MPHAGLGLPLAVLRALHLDHPRFDELKKLTERDWRATLDYCDRARLTLWLRETAREFMPDWVRERVDEDAVKNLGRIAGIEALYRDLADWLGAGGLEFLALKGLTHPVLFGGSAANRMQYDVDLWLP